MSPKISLKERIFSVEKFHSSARVLSMAVLSVFIIDLLDFAIGADVHFSVLLLVPVYFTVWYVNFRSGVMLSVLSSIYMLVDYEAHPKYYHHFWVAVWNLMVLLIFFVAFCWVLDLLKRELKRAYHRAKTDSLTGLLNAKAFFEVAEIERARSDRFKHPLTLCFLDLDNFKEVNDRLGHLKGSELLKEVALVIRTVVREEDWVARMGGDEFAVLFPETGPEVVEILARKLHRAVAEDLQADGIRLTASVGVVTYFEVPNDAEEIVRAADLMMYEAKRAGKNKVLFRVVERRSFS